MTKTFNCNVTIGDLSFDITYNTQQDKQDDPLGTIVIINEVQLNSYVLSLGQLREREIYNSISSYVKQDAIVKWDEVWKKFNAKQNY